MSRRLLFAALKALDYLSRSLTLVGTREGGAESPHLCIIFVCSVMACWNSVALRDGVALLDGKACRALLLADDLAIISQSAHDRRLLLDV